MSSGCGCKEVYRFPHITYPYSSCICSFLQQYKAAHTRHCYKPLSCVVFSEKLRQQLTEATSIVIMSLNSQLLKKRHRIIIINH